MLTCLSKGLVWGYDSSLFVDLGYWHDYTPDDNVWDVLTERFAVHNLLKKSVNLSFLSNSDDNFGSLDIN